MLLDFIRLEKDGTGPWNHWDNVRGMACENFRREGHWHHYESTIDFRIKRNLFGKNREDHKFGCLSIGSLTFYFGEDTIQHAIENGYRVVRYLVPKEAVIFGKGEAAVHKKYLLYPEVLIESKKPESKSISTFDRIVAKNEFIHLATRAEKPWKEVTIKRVFNAFEKGILTTNFMDEIKEFDFTRTDITPPIYSIGVDAGKSIPIQPP